MATIQLPPYAYQETRLDLDSKPADLRAELLIPSKASKTPFASSSSSRPVPKRRRIEGPSAPSDETTFSTQHLAVESAIHFRPSTRKHHQSPRSILWRVLEDRKLLELQNVDIEQDNAIQNDPMVTLRFAFEKPIRSHCIGFAEAERAATNTSALVVFVVCTDGELHTLHIDKSAWLKPNWLIEAPTNWHQSAVPSALSYRTPHRMLVCGERDIWLAVTDGGFVHLTRAPGQDASNWEQTQMSDGGWKSSFRIFRNSSIRHRGVEYDAKAALQIELSPDGEHLWSVCLDRLVRVWSLKEAKVVQTFDMTLDEARDLDKPTDNLLDPTHAGLMQIVPSLTQGETGAGYTVVLFSPSTRRFKFVRIRDPAFGYADDYPDIEFVAPLVETPGSASFNVDSFLIKQDHDHRKHTWHFWVLVRSGSASYILNLHFNAHSAPARVRKEWLHDWSAAHAGLNSTASLDQDQTNPRHLDIEKLAAEPSSIARAWLSFLLHPGRFSSPLLETAIAVYGRALSDLKTTPAVSLTDDRDLQTRIAELVGCRVVLEYDRTGAPETLAYLRSASTQWETFYGIVKNLQSQRERILAINIDPLNEQPWTTMADFTSPLRTFSELEIIYHNRRSISDTGAAGLKGYLGAPGILRDSREAQLLGKVLWISSWLRRTLNSSFVSSFQSALDLDVALSSQEYEQTRMLDVYESSGFLGQIGDDEYTLFNDHMNRIGGFQLIKTTIFEAAGQLLKQDSGDAKRHEAKHFVHYGVASIVRASQEVTQTGFDMLLDLLVLVVWMSSELEAEDLPPDFNAGDIFALLMIQYKQYSLLQWLLSTSPLNSSRGRPSASHRTLHERLFRGDLARMSYPSISQAALITFFAQRWTLAMTVNGDFEAVTPYIVSELLKASDTTNALDGVRFLPETPWAKYLKARTYLANAKFENAAYLFKSNTEELGKLTR